MPPRKPPQTVAVRSVIVELNRLEHRYRQYADANTHDPAARAKHTSFATGVRSAVEAVREVASRAGKRKGKKP